MRNFTLAALLVAIGMSVVAQEPCGFDAIHKKLLDTDPGYAATIKSNNEYIRQYVASHPLPTVAARGASTTALYTIPVVVHVVHTGGAIGTIYNPTDAQISGAIDYLNNIYNGTDPSLYGGVGDMQIQFALAQRDPNCNPTSGINHVDGSSIPNYAAFGVNRSNSNGASELSVKNFIRWDPTTYYNIWVVDKIDGADGTVGSFIAGFAYFPGASTSLDGTIMLATQMKTGAKTLPHEIGHALNLYHTFQGSSNSVTCPVNNNCSSDGDMICDTDPVTAHTDFSCRTGTNPCTGASYGINTESNFMGYTNCYTLFTAGQKARALAAMTLPSRASLAASLGATPTYSGAVQCTPLVNFENSGTTVTEANTGTIDCRKYTDYTVNMTIASNPSASTTATLQLSGTATNMIDYQVTTNGSFTSPSLQLTFPAGAHASKSFTIRVFENSIIDFTRTVVVDFTLNNGGGNAAKGSASPSYTLSINDNDYAPQTYSAVNAAIGTGGASFNQPFRGEYQQSRTQALYTATELSAAGLGAGSKITSISLNVTNKSSATPFTGLNIGMKNSSATGLSTGGFETGITNVYTGDYSTVFGVNTITLTTPFVWDGSSNLVVEMCYGKASASASSDNIAGTVQSTAMCIWNRAATGTGCSLAPQYNSITGVGFVRPDITFNAQTGNPVASSLNTTQTEYLGPYADIYFYSNNSVVGRVKNLTSFDYGCTSFKIDRAGNNSANFWNTSAGNNLTDKTFLITPTNNTSGGQYEVTLYYTAAEKSGYEATTAKSWNSISMVKSPLAISGTNSSTTTTSAVIAQPVVTRTAFGSDFAVKGSFSGGFGGFASGDPAPIFPLKWLSFTGKITRDWNAELSWTTSNEVNTSHFEVEESMNGTSFNKIGTVQSIAPTGSGSFNYSYVHVKPAPGNHYYRIKQLDKDGRFTYSTTVMLYVDNTQDIFVYPVPANDKLVLKFGKPLQNPVIEILSADMKLIAREPLTGSLYEKEMNIKNLASGMYVIRIVTAGKPQVIRFVKQ